MASNIVDPNARIADAGGNHVRWLTPAQSGKQLFGSGPYEYFLYRTTQSESAVFDELGSFSVYLLRNPGNGTVCVVGEEQLLATGDCVQSENCSVQIRVKGGPVDLLIAGTTQAHSGFKGMVVTRHADLYRVVKPWGHEIWINGEHPGYALKQIHLRAGTKTSLQYHHFKQETNVLVHGTAKLHYKANASVSNDDVTEADIAAVTLEPLAVVGVEPPTLHRLEAVTDITLYETSTPHLNDVMRVQDDSGRPSGRIATEHHG